MTDFKDPLTFGAAENLEDLTEQLDATLGRVEQSAGSYTLGDDPLHSVDRAAAAAEAADPFDALAASSRQAEHDMPYTTYGQLVTPTGNLQQPQQQQLQQAPAVAPDSGPPGTAAAAQDSATAADSASSSQQGLGAAQQAVPLAPAAGAAPEAQDSLGSLPSPVGPHHAVPTEELPLVVTVSDPLRREAAGVLGMTATHVEYLVTTRSSLPGWSQPEVAVRRRFRDFVALAELLKAQFRGYFVPPRPEKNAVEGQRMSDAFVEERRLALQKYLQKLAAHPAIGPSEALQVFLETPGELSNNFRWSGMLPASASIMEGAGKFSMQLIGRESRVVDPVAAAQPAARSKDLMRAMKEAAQGIGMRGGREVPLDELDLRRLRDAADEMREQLSVSSRAAEKLVNRLDQLGSTAGDLGLSLFKVAKFEEAEGGALASYTGTLRYSSGLIADQKRTAAALVRISKMVAKVTGRVALELGTLHDNLAAMPAAVRGHMSREHQMLTWHTLEADLEAKQKALADMDKSKTKRVDDLRTDISCLELSIGAAKAEYEKIKAVNLAETARFAAERRAEYMSMLENFTATQVAAAERTAEVWVQLASELGASREELAAVRANTSSGTDLLATAPQPPLS